MEKFEPLKKEEAGNLRAHKFKDKKEKSFWRSYIEFTPKEDLTVTESVECSVILFNATQEGQWENALSLITNRNLSRHFKVVL